MPRRRCFRPPTAAAAGASCRRPRPAPRGRLPGRRSIVLGTRAARLVTIARQRHKLALELQVIDDGPGVPEDIRDRVFNPLVSGREGGSGIGLALAPTYLQNHGGG